MIPAASKTPVSTSARATAASRRAVHGYLRHGADGRVRVRGWITQTQIDGPKAHVIYSLEINDRSGHRISLPAGGISDVPSGSGTADAPASGTVIEGRGTLKGGRLSLTSATATGTLNNPTLNPRDTTMPATTRRVLVVPYYTSASGTNPAFTTQLPPSAIADAINGTTTPQPGGIGNGALSVNALYAAASGNQLQVTAQVLPWQLLTTALPDSCNDWENQHALDANDTLLGSEDLSNYDHILYLFPRLPGCYSSAEAWGDVGGSKVFMPVPVHGTPAVASLEQYDVDTIAHELGHNVGLNHGVKDYCREDDHLVPQSTNCGSDDYSDQGDFMGGGTYRQLHGAHRAKLGLLPLKNAPIVDPTVLRTYQLNALLETGPAPEGTPELLRIPRPQTLASGNTGSGYYYLDLRRQGPSGLGGSFDAASSFVQGVAIRRSTPISSRTTSGLVPTITSGRNEHRPLRDQFSTGPDTAVTLRVGQSFYDPQENYSITNTAIAANVATIKVNPGAPPVPATSAQVVDGRLLVTAGTGVINGLTISARGTDLIVTDFGAPLLIGAGCVQLRPNQVRCPKASITSISVAAGDKADDVSIADDVTLPTLIDGGSDASVDAIQGGPGSDTIDGGPGADIIEGGAGTDFVSYAARSTGITAKIADSWTDASDNTDSDRINAVEGLIGGSGADTLTIARTSGGSIEGGLGVDVLTGGSGADTIKGRDGALDTINCGGNADTVLADSAEAPNANCELIDRSGQAEILTGPPEGSAVSSATPTFTFATRSSPFSLQCKLEDGTAPGTAAFATCGASWTAPTQTSGVKTLSVRAMSGTTPSGTTVTRTFRVDTAVPTVIFLSGPPTSTPTVNWARFEIRSNDVVTFSCWLDGIAQACSGIHLLENLADGSHTFTAKATDRAGNVSTMTATRTWTVDTTPPNTAILTGPGTPTADSTPDFTFQTGADIAGYECRTLTGALFETEVRAWAPCTASWASPSTGDGSYRFEVRAFDVAGNRDQTPATADVVIAGAGPTVTTSIVSGQQVLTVTGAVNARDSLGLSSSGSTVTVLSGLATLPIPAAPCSKPGSVVTCTGIDRIVVTLGGGADVVTYNSALPATIDGGDGDDDLRFGANSAAGAQTLTGGPGSDTARYNRISGVTVTLDGLANDGQAGENDTVGSDIEVLFGSSGDDTLTGGAGASTLRGGLGNDTLTAGSGGSVLDGGTGFGDDSDTLVGGSSLNDVADYGFRSDGLVIDRSGGRSGARTNPAEADSIDAAIETVRGSGTAPGSTMPVSTSWATENDYRDGSGSYTYYGGPGGTHVYDAGGDDTYVLGAAHDYVEDGDGNDDYDGGAGDDGFVSAATTNADIYRGGSGNDDVEYYLKVQGINVSLDGVANDGAVGENDRVDSDIESVRATNYPDQLTGDDGQNSFEARAGDDVIDGKRGSDRLEGGDGNDLVTYADRMSPLAFTFNGEAAANDQAIVGGASAETDRTTHVERWQLGGGDDTFNATGWPAGVELVGGAGADQLTGTTSADTLEGGADADVLDSGDGADTLRAVDGARDRIRCGAGTDTALVDTIDVAETGCEPLGPLEIGAATSTPATVNLTTDGTLGKPDAWTHWKSTTSSTFDRKFGSSVLGSWTLTGAGTAPTLVAGSTTFSWTDATGTSPAATATSGVATGSGTTTAGRGFRFTAPVSAANPSTLRVHVGLTGGAGKLRAWYTSSPGTVTTSAAVTTVGSSTFLVAVRPVNASDTLNVEWAQSTSTTTSKVALYAAAIYR